MKKFLDLHCDCGCSTFNVRMDAEEQEEYELICESCEKPIAHIHNYSLNWIKDDKDADSAD